VQLLERGSVLFPARIVVDGKHTGVLTRLGIERVTTVAAEMCTWSASSRWPSTMAPPPTVQCAPMRGAAGHAHAAGHGRVLADVHVVADLDQVVELDAVFDDGVLSAPRSMQVLAPISTSSPMRTAPSCSILTHRPVAQSRSHRRRSPHPRAQCSARQCGSFRPPSHATSAPCLHQRARRAPQRTAGPPTHWDARPRRHPPRRWDARRVARQHHGAAAKAA
jgi:hypothetical protein